MMTNPSSIESLVDTSGRVPIVSYDTAPTDSSKSNASLVLTYDSDSNPLTVTKTIGGVSYRKTLTWSAGNLVNVSAWGVV